MFAPLLVKRQSFSYFKIYNNKNMLESKMTEHHTNAGGYTKYHSVWRGRDAISLMIVVGVLVRENEELVGKCSVDRERWCYDLLDFFAGKEYTLGLVKTCKRVGKANEIVNYVKVRNVTRG